MQNKNYKQRQNKEKQKNKSKRKKNALAVKNVYFGKNNIYRVHFRFLQMLEEAQFSLNLAFFNEFQLKPTL